MHYSEAITSLIEHAVYEQLSPEQLNHDLRDHITQGVVAGDEETVGGIYREVAVRLHENHNEDPSRFQLAKLHYQAARRHLPPEHPAHAQTLMSEGRVCNILGDLETDRAENYNRGVNLFREAQGHFAAGSTERGEALVCEGAARCRCGRISIEPQKNFLKAIALYQEARRHFLPNLTDAAGSFHHEGDAHRSLAEWNIHPVENLNKALEVFQEGLHRAKSDDNRTAKIRLRQGQTYSLLANFVENPVELLNRAIGLFDQAIGQFEEGSAFFRQTCLDAGYAHCRLAEVAGNREENVQKAMEYVERMSRHLDSTLYLTTRSHFYNRLGDLLADPLQTWRQEIAFYQKLRRMLQLGSPGYGCACMEEAWNRRKQIHIEQWGNGAGVRAKNEPHEILKLYQEAARCFDPNHPIMESIIDGQMGTYRLMAAVGIDPIVNSQKADTLNRQLTQSRSDRNDINFRLANTRTDSVENLRSALNLYQQIREDLFLKSAEESALCLREAEAYLRLAELGVDATVNLHAAIERCERAFEFSRTINSVDSVHTTSNSSVHRQALFFKAHALWKLGETRQAYDVLRERLIQVEKIQHRIASESYRLVSQKEYVTEYIMMHEICLDLVNQASDNAEANRWRWEAWHWVHRCKNRVLLERLSSFRPRLSEVDAKLWDAFERCAREHDSLERSLRHETALPPRIRQARRKQLRKVEQVYREAENAVIERIEGAKTFLKSDVPKPNQVIEELRTLSLPSPRRSPLLSEPAPIHRRGGGGGQAEGEVKKTLLVEFFTTGDSDVTAFLVPLWQDGAPIVKRFSVEQPTLPQMANTLSNASRVLRPLTRGRIRGETAPSPEAERNAKAQFERFPNEMSQLVAPWASYLEAWQPTELIFSPHSWLNLLPLHAAIWNGKPLIEHVPIAYLPSAALAGEFAKRRKPITGNALLIGNPTGDLISAEMEAHKVAELLKTQHIHAKLFLRDEATAQRIIDNVPEAGIVHTACHSQLDPHDFLRSGMEMADRRLTALEIMNRIDFSQVALVYLSSCDGATSLPEHTDELMALVRAFLSAGAPTVIASLWPLDDGYACLFAEAFYQSWMQDRQPMPVAFREAMNFVRRMAPNPFYWAPLILMGAWEAEQSVPAFRDGSFHG